MAQSPDVGRRVEALAERVKRLEAELHTANQRTGSKRSKPAGGLRRFGSQLQGRSLIISAAVLAILAAPIAIAAGTGDALRLSKRNPSSGSATGETEIIASNSTYGTRQSNKKSGDGGGAIYGCRSNPGKEPCVRGNNLREGRAFEFETDGSEGGYIKVDGATPRPFTTNATAVATGLNADRLDDLEGADYVAESDSLWAVVDAAGALARGLGVTSTTRTAAGLYQVNFNRDITGCATVVSAGDTAGGAAPAGFGSTNNGAAVGAPSRVYVYTYGAGGAFTDMAFHLIVECSS